MSALVHDPLTLAEAARIMREAYGERLVSKIVRVNDCWIWTASVTSDGYGRFGCKGSWTVAHRVVYELLVGPIPDGLTLDHLCRSRACVNPAHLEPVTLRENILRGHGVGVRNAAKTHCKYGHEFTPENTYLNAGKRHCRECGRRTTAAWHEQQRQKKRASA